MRPPTPTDRAGFPSPVIGALVGDVTGRWPFDQSLESDPELSSARNRCPPRPQYRTPPAHSTRQSYPRRNRRSSLLSNIVGAQIYSDNAHFVKARIFPQVASDQSPTTTTEIPPRSVLLPLTNPSVVGCSWCSMTRDDVRPTLDTEIGPIGGLNNRSITGHTLDFRIANVPRISSHNRTILVILQNCCPEWVFIIEKANNHDKSSIPSLIRNRCPDLTPSSYPEFEPPIEAEPPESVSVVL